MSMLYFFNLQTVFLHGKEVIAGEPTSVYDNNNFDAVHQRGFEPRKGHT
jgi:hypothetical protein